MKLYSLSHDTLPSLPLSSMAPNRPWIGTSLRPRGWGPLLYSVLPLEVGITGSKLEFLQIGTFSQLGHASCIFFQKSVSLPTPPPPPQPLIWVQDIVFQRQEANMRERKISSACFSTLESTFQLFPLPYNSSWNLTRFHDNKVSLSTGRRQANGDFFFSFLLFSLTKIIILRQ